MALDIQDLREGRELWSKAKQPGVAATRRRRRLAAEKDKGVSHRESRRRRSNPA